MRRGSYAGGGQGVRPVAPPPTLPSSVGPLAPLECTQVCGGAGRAYIRPIRPLACLAPGQPFCSQSPLEAGSGGPSVVWWRLLRWRRLRRSAGPRSAAPPSLAGATASDQVVRSDGAPYGAVTGRPGGLDLCARSRALAGEGPAWSSQPPRHFRHNKRLHGHSAAFAPAAGLLRHLLHFGSLHQWPLVAHGYSCGLTRSGHAQALHSVAHPDGDRPLYPRHR